jgi:hypothetical protein
MARKILKVKQNNEEGIESVGGASGITSFLSRTKPVPKPLTIAEQHDSIQRLFINPPVVPKIKQMTAEEEHER